MTNGLEGRHIAFVIANEGVEQVELTTPWQAVLDAGGTPELARPRQRLGPSVQSSRQGRRLLSQPGRRPG